MQDAAPREPSFDVRLARRAPTGLVMPRFSLVLALACCASFAHSMRVAVPVTPSAPAVARAPAIAMQYKKPDAWKNQHKFAPRGGGPRLPPIFSWRPERPEDLPFGYLFAALFLGGGAKLGLHNEAVAILSSLRLQVSMVEA